MRKVTKNVQLPVNHHSPRMEQNLFVVIVTLALVQAALSQRGAQAKLKVVYSVNCGGAEHTDSNGIRYERDMSEYGIISDYGTRWDIRGVPPEDAVVYQTERYDHKTFGYDIEIPPPGEYVLVMQFAEVYFTSADQKVFDVLLNHEHIIVDGIDIFDRSGGRGIAYQEIIPFVVKRNKLQVFGEESDLRDSMRLDFVKTTLDNPKCNAFYIAQGMPSDVPKLQTPTPPQPKDEPPDEVAQAREVLRDHLGSGPPVEDPYEQDKSQLLPVWIAISVAPVLAYFVWRM